MSTQVTTAMVQGYKSGIELEFQQKGSRLRSTVRNEMQNVEFEFYDRIGPTDAVEILTRHGDTPLVQQDHSRRRIALRDFDWADLIDRADKLRLLSDPTSPYTQNAVYALGRKMDDLIIEAASGTAYTGKTGSTTVSYDTAFRIGEDFKEDGTTADSDLTIGKLRQARYLLGAAEAIEDGQKLTAAVTAKQIQALLRTTEVTSADYNSIKALVAGEVNTFLGMNFVRTERLTKTGDDRTCLVYPETAITLAVAQEITVDVGPRRDKRNSTQVYVCGHFGATRMWEEQVIEVECDETA